MAGILPQLSKISREKFMRNSKIMLALILTTAAGFLAELLVENRMQRVQAPAMAFGGHTRSNIQ